MYKKKNGIIVERGSGRNSEGPVAQQRKQDLNSYNFTCTHLVIDTETEITFVIYKKNGKKKKMKN